MSVRRGSRSRADAPRVAEAAPQAPPPSGTDTHERDDVANAVPPVLGPLSLEEAEAAYVTARDAWIEAMRRANTGRPADLASLAITQGAYELATAEVERWRSGKRVAIPVEPDAKRAGLEAAIGNEMAWRRVHDVIPKQPGRIARVLRRVTGRR